MAINRGGVWPSNRPVNAKWDYLCDGRNATANPRVLKDASPGRSVSPFFSQSMTLRALCLQQPAWRRRIGEVLAMTSQTDYPSLWQYVPRGSRPEGLCPDGWGPSGCARRLGHRLYQTAIFLYVGLWPLTPRIDRATYPFLKFDRATWTLVTATWGAKR